MSSETSPTGSSPTPDALNLTLKIPISWPSEGPLTRDWIDNLTAVLDWSSRNLTPSELPSVLPFDVVQRLILTASNILHNEPNCVHIDPPIIDQAGGRGRVVVVGDVHGQLHDVLFLLRDAGFPSEERMFVFNGDYVDRGAWGLETFLLLLAWKLMKRGFLLSPVISSEKPDYEKDDDTDAAIEEAPWQVYTRRRTAGAQDK